MSVDDMDQVSMLDLFQAEVETQTQVLSAGLLALERDRSSGDQLEACMRAAHSLKGAANIVGLKVGVSLAHAMEDCFVAAQQHRTALQNSHIDVLLAATDLLMRIANTPESDIGTWATEKKSDVDMCLAALAAILRNDPIPQSAPIDAPVAPAPQRRATDTPTETSDRVLRVTAEHLNRLLALAGESLVESRWVKPFSESLLRLKRIQRQSSKHLDNLRAALPPDALDDHAQSAFAEAQRIVLECEQILEQRMLELDMFDRRSINLSNRLYDEALSCRMRPFADGVQSFPRMVRDVARTLGKEVQFEIVGETTQVDRDILAKLDAPLGHLLRNAIDHGLESPDERRAAGKPANGRLRLEARHSAGALHVTIADDGRGIDIEQLRQLVVERQLIDSVAAAALGEAELLEFLFLPGFSTKATVTDISGRGVGLDVVQDMVKQVHGTARIFSQLGAGTRFQLQLPVTLSVMRALLVEIGGEPYAFPLAHIIRTIKLPNDQLKRLEGRPHFEFNGRRIGLLNACDVLETSERTRAGDNLSVIVIGDASHVYGLVVDRFLGERELVLQPLDAHLGKIRDIAAGALMPDGSPVLIVDVEDVMRSMDKLVSGGGISQIQNGRVASEAKKRKRVLVVDDSLTVREVERKLLRSRGYDVEIAVDGMDGWNAVRAGQFNLVITDIDMPRMDGIELVGLINKDPHLKSIPVMVVSYKDRDEDRRRGLDAGASYYLTKESFRDETLLRAVADLIGEAES